MATFEQLDIQFHASLGQAIARWTTIEDVLLKIFSLGLRAKNPEQAAAAFYANINFRAKQDMTDAVLATLNLGPLYEEWERLAKRLKKKASKRGKLVHNQLVYQGQKDGSLLPLLKPVLNKPDKRLDFILGTDDLNTASLQDLTKEFNQFRNELEEFRAKLEAHLEQPPASP